MLFFYRINLIVAYPLNQNKLYMLANFENWGWEAAKLDFLAIFEPEPLAT